MYYVMHLNTLELLNHNKIFIYEVFYIEIMTYKLALIGLINT